MVYEGRGYENEWYIRVRDRGAGQEGRSPEGVWVTDIRTVEDNE